MARAILKELATLGFLMSTPGRKKKCTARLFQRSGSSQQKYFLRLAELATVFSPHAL
jgi:hypothetical protein